MQKVTIRQDTRKVFRALRLSISSGNEISYCKARPQRANEKSGKKGSDD